jgi:hypothetical protein
MRSCWEAKLSGLLLSQGGHRTASCYLLRAMASTLNGRWSEGEAPPACGLLGFSSHVSLQLCSALGCPLPILISYIHTPYIHTYIVGCTLSTGVRNPYGYISIHTSRRTRTSWA